jgi:hypothetical protein
VAGDSVVLERPQLNPVNVQIVLHEGAPHSQEPVTIVLRAHGRAHTATSLGRPENLACRFVPPDSPERTPIERLWPEGKPPGAWVLAAAIDEVAHHVERLMNHEAKAAIRSLPSSPDVVQPVHALCS